MRSLAGTLICLTSLCQCRRIKNMQANAPQENGAQIGVDCAIFQSSLRRRSQSQSQRGFRVLNALSLAYNPEVAWQIDGVAHECSPRNAAQRRLLVPCMRVTAPAKFEPARTSWLYNGSRPGYVVHHEAIVPSTVALSTPLPEVLVAVDPERFPSMSSARKAIRRGTILINGAESRCIATAGAGDMIAIQSCVAAVYQPSGKEANRLEVVYEDDALAVVVKPGGISMHPPLKGEEGHGKLTQQTMQTLIPRSLQPPPIGTKDAFFKPLACHRLDKATSGLVLCAKTDSSIRAIHRHFEERTVGKQYRAVVCGHVEGDEGEIDSPVDGLKAQTKWRVLSRARSPSLGGGHLTELALYPRTGRTHQLRRHCAEVLGTPILGDKEYGSEDADLGMFLSSIELRFAHPDRPADAKPMHISIEPPKKFRRLLWWHQNNWEQMHGLVTYDKEPGKGDALHTAAGQQRKAAVVVVRSEGSPPHGLQVLMEVRKRTLNGSAFFPAVPNGPGETTRQAAERLSQEQLGIKMGSELVSLGVVGCSNQAIEHFVLREFSGQPMAKSGQSIRWVDLLDLNSTVPLLWSAKATLQALREELGAAVVQ